MAEETDEIKAVANYLFLEHGWDIGWGGSHYTTIHQVIDALTACGWVLIDRDAVGVDSS